MLLQILFVIASPDVYKSGGDTFIVFGEAKIEDLSAQAAQSAAQDAFKPDRYAAGAKAAAAASADEGDVDETGVSPKDIELVMQQSQVSRAGAVAV